MRRGFTLIELLLVIGLIGVLASVVIVAINPLKQLSAAEDVRRKNSASQLQKALAQYLVEYDEFPGTDTIPGEAIDALPICRAGAAESNGCINVDALITSAGNFLPCLPRDGKETNAYYSGFSVYQNTGLAFVTPLHLGEPSGGSTCEKPPVAIARWKFDEGSGTTARNTSESGYDGTLINGPTWTASVPSNAFGPFALDFDGVNDYIAVPGFTKTLTHATFTMWAKLRTHSEYDGLVFSRGSNVTGMLMSSGAGTKLTYCWNADPNTYGWAGGPTLPLNEWLFLAVSVSPSSATAYVVSSAGLSSGTNTVNHSAAIIDDLKIGIDDLGMSRTTDGVFDDVRIYDSALSEAQIVALSQGSP